VKTLNPPPAEPALRTELLAATSVAAPDQHNALARARAFAEPLIATEQLDTGENTLAHADAVAAILRTIGSSPDMQAGAYLVYACEHLTRPQDAISKAFGDHFAALALETNKLVKVQRQARTVHAGAGKTSVPMAQTAAMQVENVRKMLLAFSRDLRVVLLRLASRLQTLRHFAASKRPVPEAIARESLQVFAPLANRLGIWEIKWEMEDLAFRFLEPVVYREVATLLDEKRAERELYVQQLRERIERALAAEGIVCSVQGRPKHIFSIVKKMRGKSLGFDQVYDIRALRVIVGNTQDCYAALSWVHSQFQAVAGEFDDYIAKPKSNGYQSLHTIVQDSAGRPIEIQIRTQAMHDHAEHGVAAHWAYKEAGVKGYAGVSASGEYDAKIAVLRQLLAWERDLSAERSGLLGGHDPNQDPGKGQGALFDDRIYVLTPEAAIVELPQGATPVDFAYSVHTNLGHRCRGARVDGAMVPLNTPLKNGQTVEVTVAKEGGPSRDWLNPELGFLVGQRARAKVRAWFNALAHDETVARGRDAVEKLLQREGKTAIKLDELAAQLGFKVADDLFEAVGKDEFSLRSVELVLRPAEAHAPLDDAPILKKSKAADPSAKGGVLVLGVGSLMTQLAKCCKPAPPDLICGFVTRGKGVSVHRLDCSNLREMVAKNGERVIEVQWGTTSAGEGALYPVDVSIEATDRTGLLRDISEVFTKEKMNVTGVQTQSLKGMAWMTFTVEVADSGRLQKVLSNVRDLRGVQSARRK
jgi:GTP pyrophosphokinase